MWQSLTDTLIPDVLPVYSHRSLSEKRSSRSSPMTRLTAPPLLRGSGCFSTQINAHGCMLTSLTGATPVVSRQKPPVNSCLLKKIIREVHFYLIHSQVLKSLKMKVYPISVLTCSLWPCQMMPVISPVLTGIHIVHQSFRFLYTLNEKEFIFSVRP